MEHLSASSPPPPSTSSTSSSTQKSSAHTGNRRDERDATHSNLDNKNNDNDNNSWFDELMIFLSISFNYCLFALLLPLIVTFIFVWPYLLFRLLVVDRAFLEFLALLCIPLIVVLPSYRKAYHLIGDGRPWDRMRHSRLLYHYGARYFPIRLVRTAPLPAVRPGTDEKQLYIFGVHPHGIIPTFVSIGIMAEGCGWESQFPGISRRGLAASSNFTLPIWRDIYLSIGYIDASLPSAQRALNKGHSLVILPGGEQEMLIAKPGDHSLVLRGRKGFVRLAIQHGANLVPVYCFGANDSYVWLPFAQRINQWLSRKYHMVIPVFFGRWGTPYPHRKPIAIVVGDAIPVTKKATPTDQEVDELHEKYMDALKQLFDRHKIDYGCEDQEVQFLEAQSHSKSSQQRKKNE